MDYKELIGIVNKGEFKKIKDRGFEHVLCYRFERKEGIFVDFRRNPFTATLRIEDSNEGYENTCITFIGIANYKNGRRVRYNSLVSRRTEFNFKWGVQDKEMRVFLDNILENFN